MESISLNNHRISISNYNKIWFPHAKISKGAIVDYYATMGEYLVKHSKNHALTVQRFPDGITGESFYQKNAPDYFPSWIKTVSIAKEEGGQVHYVLPNSAATFAYLATQGALTFHCWLSRFDKLQMPDRLVFDLDPSTNNFSYVREAALLIKDILDEIDVPTFPMTTGSHGMHVFVPLKRVHTFAQVATFAYTVAHKMIAYDPKRYTLEIRKEKRGNKIFIDTLRNRFSATSVVPYSVRPHEKAPVAAPLWWDEVHKSTLSSQKFTVKTIRSRVKSEGDPWEQVNTYAVSLLSILKKIERGEE